MDDGEVVHRRVTQKVYESERFVLNEKNKNQ